VAAQSADQTDEREVPQHDTQDDLISFRTANALGPHGRIRLLRLRQAAKTTARRY